MRTFVAMSNASTPYVLALGGANMDITAMAAHVLTPGESIPGRVRHAPGGVARNVAENLARLGHAVRLISAVGDDLLGQSLLQGTGRAGVDVSNCLVLPGHASSSYVSLHGVDGEMALAVNDMEILHALSPERLAPRVMMVQEAQALVLDCNLSEAALAWVFAQPRQGPVFADAVSSIKAQRLRPWLAQLHTLKLNRAEAQTLCGMEVASLEQAHAAAAWFVQQGVRTLSLSLGELGLCWHSATGARGLQAAIKVKAVNASGAGDALLAGLVHAHLAGWPLAQAMPFASACAALTMQSESANHAGLSVAAVRALLAAKSGA